MTLSPTLAPIAITANTNTDTATEIAILAVRHRAGKAMLVGLPVFDCLTVYMLAVLA